MSDQSPNSEFPKTDLNTVKRAPARGNYDRKTVYQILDESLIANIAFTTEHGPVLIPMMFARDGDELLFHGATTSRLMQVLTGGESVCLSVTIVDGLVLAKSLFHHSMNYRSVTCYGRGHEVTKPEDRLQALEKISDKTMPGRWTDSRQPSEKEMKATRIAAITIESASAKVRTGPPVEDADDVSLPYWSGVVPLRTIADSPVACQEHSSDVEIPGYLSEWVSQKNQTPEA